MNTINNNIDNSYKNTNHIYYFCIIDLIEKYDLIIIFQLLECIISITFTEKYKLVKLFKYLTF